MCTVRGAAQSCLQDSNQTRFLEDERTQRQYAGQNLEKPLLRDSEESIARSAERLLSAHGVRPGIRLRHFGALLAIPRSLSDGTLPIAPARDEFHRTSQLGPTLLGLAVESRTSSSEGPRQEPGQAGSVGAITDCHVKERYTQIRTAGRECGPPLRRHAKNVRGSHGMEDAVA
jgi:hypothetical protein